MIPSIIWVGALDNRFSMLGNFNLLILDFTCSGISYLNSLRNDWFFY